MNGARPVATLNLGGTRRAYTFAQLDALRSQALTWSAQSPSATSAPPRTPGPLRDAVRATTRQRVIDVLQASGGRVGLAARALGIERRTLSYHCKRYGIRATDYRSPGLTQESPCATD